MKIFWPILLFTSLFFIACTPKTEEISKDFDPEKSPVLKPEDALKTFVSEKGFEIEIIAAEPLLHDPVAMVFDAQNRIWVVEMKGYMPDTEGRGEDEKNGSISVLEDKDGDGFYESSHIFLDNLVLPRALCLIYDGLLYAEPPNLFFTEIQNDRPGKTILIDSTYAAGGNVEHQANGLILGADNWIYSAKSDKRYRRKNGIWKTEKTEFRGQWGISRDNYGRLIHNNNSNQLRGDFAPANKINRHPFLGENNSIDAELVANQQVYPIRPTPGVNRGYMENILDDSLKLNNFTAACGPLVYLGHAFPAEYYGNAFVAEPAANLIKRNILTANGIRTEGRQAYENREFLASTDERFRPVNLYNGPDGSLYVVDMYRGIIQHSTYLTEYLKEEIKKRGLEKPLGFGRIYRIRPKGTKPEMIKLSEASETELLGFLGHKNAWIRQTAGRILLHRNSPNLSEKIRLILENESEENLISEALTLAEELEICRPEILQKITEKGNSQLSAAAVRAAEPLFSAENAPAYLAVFEQLIKQKEIVTTYQTAFSLGELLLFDQKKVSELLVKIVRNFPEDRLISEAVLSSLPGREKEFAARTGPDTSDVHRLIRQVFVNQKNAEERQKTLAILPDELRKGKELFEEICSGCHGPNGEGIRALAPPLAKSEWVKGDPNQLISIVLHGFTGPVTVNGKVYQQPEIAPLMPGIAGNKDLSDEKIAQILTYIRKSWTHESGRIDAQKVGEIREQLKDRKEPFRESDF